MCTVNLHISNKMFLKKGAIRESGKNIEVSDMPSKGQNLWVEKSPAVWTGKLRRKNLKKCIPQGLMRF